MKRIEQTKGINGSLDRRAKLKTEGEDSWRGEQAARLYMNGQKRLGRGEEHNSISCPVWAMTDFAAISRLPD